MSETAEPAATVAARPKLARSTTFAYLSSVVGAGVGLVNVALTARLLGAEGRGQLVFLMAVAMVSSYIASLGMHQAVANFAGAGPARSRSLAGTSVLLSLVLGAMGAAVVGLVLAVAPTAASGVAWPVIALVLIGMPVMILQLALQHLALAHYRFGFHNAAWVLPRLINAALNGALVLFGVLTVGTAVLTWLIGQVATTGLLTWAVVTRLGGFGLPRLQDAREVLAFGLRDHLGRILTIGSYGIDQWIVGAVAGATALGTYSVAVSWVEVVYFLPSALVAVQRPDLVRASPPEAHDHAARGFRYAALLTIPTVAGLMAFAPFLTVTLFGDDFAPSIWQLRVLSLGAFGVVALKVLSNALTAQGRPMLATGAASATFVALIALDVVLVPLFGALGAAAGAAVAFNIGGFVAAVIFLRHLQGPARDLVPRRSDIRGAFELARKQARRGGPDDANRSDKKAQPAL